MLEIFCTIVAYAIFVIYGLIGGICDVVTKVAAFIICIPFIIVFALIMPFKDNFHVYWLRPVADHASKWKFNGYNYPCFNFLTKKFRDL